MAKLYVFLAVCIASSLAAVELQDMEITPKVVKKGDTVSMKCPVINQEFGFLIAFNKYHHPLGEQEGKEEEALDKTWEKEGFTLNKNIEVPNDDGRFSMDITPDPEDDSIYYFTLSISDVKESDGGYYSCELRMGSPPYTEKYDKFFVVAPPQGMDMHLTHNGQLTPIGDEEQDIKFKVNDEITVKCESSGSYPEADVSIMAASRDLWEMADESKKSEVIKRDYIPHDGEVKGHALTYTVTREVTLPITLALGGQKITCKSMVGDLKETVKKAFRVTMDGVPPQLPDCPTEMTTVIHREFVQFACVYSAVPALEKSEIHWESLGDQEVVMATAAGTPAVGGKYVAKLEEEDGEQRIVLIFERMYPQMFRNYTFVLQNNVGETRHTFTIVRDYSQEPSGSSHVGYSVLVMMAMLCVRWLF